MTLMTYYQAKIYMKSIYMFTPSQNVFISAEPIFSHSCE